MSKTAVQNIIQEIQTKYSYFNKLSKNFSNSWINANRRFRLNLQYTRWKNDRAPPGCSYRPTELEQKANVLTHGIIIIPAIVAACTLFNRSQSFGQVQVSWVYGGSLTLLFIVSTFFHCACFDSHHTRVKKLLHRCDRAMIYVFIASSYYPWLQLANESQSKILSCLEWLIWLMALSGIAYQQIFHEKYKLLETVFYVVMGLGPALVVIFSGLEFNGMLELKIGGLIYILGICFFKMDGVVPFAHAIWHLFVVLAAGFHYYAILNYLYPIEQLTI